MEKNKITIEAQVKAEVKKVWNYWTAPERITQWNFASPEWQCPSASNDLRKGGKYIARMEAKDGSFGFDFEAVYNDVVPEKRLSYVMSDGREAVTTFERAGEYTIVTTIFDAENTHPIDFQKAGWQAILDNFKNYTERN